MMKVLRRAVFFLSIPLLASCSGMNVPGSFQITITTQALPEAFVGQSYSAQMQAAGGTPPYVWSVISGSLPKGLILSSSGLLSGIPESAGVFSITIQVQDSMTGTNNLQIGEK